MSSFYILVGFVINLLFGRFFKPFFSLPKTIAVNASIRCENNSADYKSCVRKGAILTIFACIAAFLLCDIISVFVVNSQYNLIYRLFFIIGGVIFSKAGQLVGTLKKIRKGITHNSNGYIERCLDELLIPNRDKVTGSNYYSVLSAAVTKICAEFVITPIIIALLCPERFVISALAVYLIISVRSIYINDYRIITHGYFVFAQKLTSILSYPAYFMLNLMIFIFKWVVGIRAEGSKEKKLVNKCSDNIRKAIYKYDEKEGTALSARQVNLLRWLTVFSLFMSAIIVLAISIFVIAVFTPASV